MKDKESSQSLKLNLEYRDINTRFNAGFRGFAITHQSPLLSKLVEGSFHNEAEWQYFNGRSNVGKFQDLKAQFGAESLDPVDERFAGVATTYPHDANPGEPAQPRLRTICTPSRSVVLAGVAATPNTNPKGSPADTTCVLLCACQYHSPLCHYDLRV